MAAIDRSSVQTMYEIWNSSSSGRKSCTSYRNISQSFPEKIANLDIYYQLIIRLANNDLIVEAVRFSGATKTSNSDNRTSN